MLNARRDDATGHYRLQGANDTFCAEANRFLETLTARGMSSLTVRSYAFALARFHRWFAAQNIPFESLEQSNLVGYISDLREEKATPRTINHRLTVVRSYYIFVVGRAMTWGIGACPGRAKTQRATYDRKLGLQRVTNTRSDPILRVKTPQTLIEPLTSDQVKALLGTLRRYRDIAITYMMLLGGLRSREVLEITIDDINASDGSLRVFGKGGKERILPIAPPLRTALTRYIKYERPRGCKTQRLFVVLQGPRRGRHMSISGLRSLFRIRRQNARLRNANPHRLRHTFGSQMARAGMSLAVLQKLMGHAYPETTMQYVRISMRDVTEAYDKALAAIKQSEE